MPHRTAQTVNTSSVGVTNNFTYIPDYFRPSTNREADKEESIILTKRQNYAMISETCSQVLVLLMAHSSYRGDRTAAHIKSFPEG